MIRDDSRDIFSLYLTKHQIVDEGLEQEPNIQLVDLGPTERGAVQYQVRVNDFTVGACIVFNNTVVFANQDMNRRIGTTVKFLPDNGMLDSLNGQQFRSIDAFKQAIKQSFQNWSINEQSNPEENREVQIGRAIVEICKANQQIKGFSEIEQLANELIQIHQASKQS